MTFWIILANAVIQIGLWGRWAFYFRRRNPQVASMYLMGFASAFLSLSILLHVNAQCR